ncbi:MAG: hypothetical protein HY553_12105 [Elusimicrobia bacterium]|nr:hypothetical protein [Elusimicrobiota bacterium]
MAPVLDPARSSLRLGTPPAAFDSRITDDPLSLDDFISLLEARVPKPLAEKFAREFMKEPVLREAWKQYRKKRGSKGKGSEFVDFVTRLPKFRQLVGKFLGDPAFKAAFAEIAKTPKLDAVIREGMGALTRFPGAGPVDKEALAREWERKARSGSISSASSAAPTVSRRMTPAVESSANSPAGGGSGGSGSSGGGQQSMTSQGLGDGAHPVETKLVELKAAGSGRSDDGWKAEETGGYVRRILRWLEENGYRDQRRAIEALLGQEDFWGACFMSGHYELCRQGCEIARVDGSSCVAASKWEACKGGGRSNVRCIQECVTRYAGQGCADEAAWQAECALGAAIIACEFCSAAYDYGPEECDPAGNCWVRLGCHGGGSGGRRQTAVAAPAEETCDAECQARIVADALATATAEWDAKQAARDAEWESVLAERDRRLKELQFTLDQLKARGDSNQKDGGDGGKNDKNKDDSKPRERGFLETAGEVTGKLLDYLIPGEGRGAEEALKSMGRWGDENVVKPIADGFNATVNMFTGLFRK